MTNATQTKHTPVPWRAVDGRYTAVGIAHMTDGNYNRPYQVAAIVADDKMADKGWRYVAVINGKSTGEVDADAEHIVRCVNAHDELLAALRALYDDARNERFPSQSDMDAARAALAKVQA